MPIPSAISDLSKVASENSPAGTESVKGTIDDYLRAGFAFIRQLSDLVSGPTVTLPSAPTVNIGFAGSSNVTITGATTITAFDSAAEGTLRWAIFAGALTLVHNATSLQLPGAANIVTTAGDVAAFKSLGGGNWKCMAYQRVAGTGPHAASASRDGYLSAGDWNSFNSRMTPAAAAATYLPFTGGTMTGSPILANGVGLYGRDTSGGLRYLTGVANDNGIYHYSASRGWTWMNFAANKTLATLSDEGVFSAVVVTETSDERKKKGWRALPGDFIERLARIKKAGVFRWKKDGAVATGIGAQSLEAILPEAVYTDERGGKMVNTGGAAMAILPEIARELVRLRARIAKLEAR